MTSYQYRKYHCGDNTILRPSYLHNGISFTGKMTSLYWNRGPYSQQSRPSLYQIRLVIRLSSSRERGYGARIRDEVAKPIFGQNIVAIDAMDYLLEMNRRRGYVDRFKTTPFHGVPKIPEENLSLSRITDASFSVPSVVILLCCIRGSVSNEILLFSG